MVKLRAYSVFQVEGIILPTDLKGYLLKKNRYNISESFYDALWSSRVYNYASLKVALSTLQFNIVELVLVA